MSRAGWENFVYSDQSYGHRHISTFVEYQLWNNTKVTTIREIRDTIEVPLVRFIDKYAVDVPGGCSDRSLLSQETPHAPKGSAF